MKNNCKQCKYNKKNGCEKYPTNKEQEKMMQSCNIYVRRESGTQALIKVIMASQDTVTSPVVQKLILTTGYVEFANQYLKERKKALDKAEAEVKYAKELLDTALLKQADALVGLLKR